MVSKQVERWGASHGIGDKALAECLWHYEKSLVSSTERNNLWVLNGGPSDFDALERTQTTLARTIEWRQSRRAFIATFGQHVLPTARLIKRLYDWDDGATMTMMALIADRRAMLGEFGSYTPKTPPAPPGSYLHQGDPGGQMTEAEERDALGFRLESYDEWSRTSAP